MTLSTTVPATAPRAATATTCRATIILINYNSADHLARCLDSLQRDPAIPDYELIVVDNASTPDDLRPLARDHPRLRLINSEENLGFGGANNLAAQQAAGKYLAFLNPDTVAEPGWLEALITALQQDAGAGLATARILLLDDPQYINAAGNTVHLSGLTLCRGFGRPATQYDQPAVVSAVSGAAFAIRRDLFQQLRGFDDTYFMYFEDTDLSLRARLAGYRCLYVPQARVHHDYHLRFGPRKTYYEERNRYLTLLKLFRRRTLLLLLPTLLLAETVTWGFTLLRDRPHWRNKLHAYRNVWRRRHTLRAARRCVQATRRLSDRALLRDATHRLAFEQTGDGLASRTAHLLFDPLFYLQRRLALALLRGERV